MLTRWLVHSVLPWVVIAAGFALEVGGLQCSSTRQSRREPTEEIQRDRPLLEQVALQKIQHLESLAWRSPLAHSTTLPFGYVGGYILVSADLQNTGATKTVLLDLGSFICIVLAVSLCSGLRCID
ncbi:hypothetical protein ACQ4M4_08905 [Leptolyngbya sp. AN02str]|uniref:hypothetical protein n=1 Tax=Leptolyngbya sp. AN02str TaxID=3423363 RepID=UPI003D323E32